MSSQTLSASGDFMIINTNGNYYLEAQNSSGVMSQGYQSDWEVANEAPSTGYSLAGVPLIFQTGYVFLIQTLISGNYYYGKIQITGINGNQIQFNWAYQKNQNNGDI